MKFLTHELTHFMKFPGNVLNVLRLQKSAKGIVEGPKVSELRTAFTEAQTNIYMLNEETSCNSKNEKSLWIA